MTEKLSSKPLPLHSDSAINRFTHQNSKLREIKLYPVILGVCRVSLTAIARQFRNVSQCSIYVAKEVAKEVAKYKKWRN